MSAVTDKITFTYEELRVITVTLDEDSLDMPKSLEDLVTMVEEIKDDPHTFINTYTDSNWSMCRGSITDLTIKDK